MCKHDTLHTLLIHSSCDVVNKLSQTRIILAIFETHNYISRITKDAILITMISYFLCGNYADIPNAIKYQPFQILGSFTYCYRWNPKNVAFPVLSSPPNRAGRGWFEREFSKLCMYTFGKLVPGNWNAKDLISTSSRIPIMTRGHLTLYNKYVGFSATRSTQILVTGVMQTDNVLKFIK